jgi:hypothetical protein
MTISGKLLSVQKLYAEYIEKNHMPVSSDICVFCGSNCSSPDDLADHIAKKHLTQVRPASSVSDLHGLYADPDPAF